MEGGDSIELSMKPLMAAVTCNNTPAPSLARRHGRHVKEAGLMEQQNDWIFKKAALTVALYPAHKYELYSVDIKTHIVDIGLCMIHFSTFLCPF